MDRSEERADDLLDEGVSRGEATLDDFRPTKLYYRIGEVSEITGVKPYVLRYWETEFKWVSPQKSRSKQRLYRPKDIELILLVKKLLYEERFTIAGARKRLKEVGVDQVKVEILQHAAGVDAAPSAAGQRVMKGELLSLKEELLAIRGMLSGERRSGAVS